MRVSESPSNLPGEVMPLVGYSPFWLVLGIGLLVVVIVYYLLAWAFTRERRVAAFPIDAARTPIDLAAARERAQRQITEIQQRVLAEGMSERAAYEQLSATVREFVAEATGVPASHMTLSELSRTRLTGTTRTVAQLYPGIFAEHANYNLPAAVADARAVVSGWS